MDRREVEKMRQRGLTRSTSAGVEAIHITAQFRDSLTEMSRQERRAVLEGWEQELRERLKTYGGEIIPNSLSITAQTVEALVPVDSITSTEKELVRHNMRIDFPVPHQVTE